jgi:hypothetical protein
MDATVVPIAVGAGLTVGFVAGLWSFRIKSRWCPDCGSMTWTCPSAPASGEPGRRHG